MKKETLDEFKERLLEAFPGYLDDTEVSGADLVEWIGNELIVNQ